MQDPPSPAAILGLVIAQLGAPGDADARGRFEMRVTLAALQLVRRAFLLAPASDAAEQRRLAALLGEAGECEALNRRLCARIQDGSLTLASLGLAQHLRATAMEKLAIDQPTYAAYQQALKNL